MDALMTRKPSKPLREAQEAIDKLTALSDGIDEYAWVLSSSTGEITLGFLQMPFPAWLKYLAPDGKSFRMGPINQAYEIAYFEADAYFGQPDSSLWKHTEPETFGINDRRVVKERHAIRVIERIVNPKTGDLEDLDVIKWPVSVGGKIIGVAGMVLATMKV